MTRKISKITKRKSKFTKKPYTYVKDQNHKHYKVKSQTQMRKYRKMRSMLQVSVTYKSDIAT